MGHETRENRSANWRALFQGLTADLRCRMLMGAAGTCGGSFERLRSSESNGYLPSENSWLAFTMTNLFGSISLVEESSPCNNSSVYHRNSKLSMILSNVIDESLMIEDEPRRNTIQNTKTTKIVHQNTHEKFITKMRIKIKGFSRSVAELFAQPNMIKLE